MNYDLIGLAGFARAGKSTVANILYYNHGYETMAFADPIREALERLNPLLSNGHRLSHALDEVGWEGVKADPEARRLMQVMGTEVGRQMFGENVWVEMLMSKRPAGQQVVIADVRFPNEFDAIKRAGGTVWWVSRIGVGPANGHASEHALHDTHVFDRVIRNDDDLPSLTLSIANIIGG